MTLFPLATTTATSRPVAGVTIPDSKLAREVTELVKDTESPLLAHHSSRVYYWGALTGKRRGLHFDPDVLPSTDARSGLPTRLRCARRSTAGGYKNLRKIFATGSRRQR
jgi:hypothetical protein